jgi:hypothetical protein
VAKSQNLAETSIATEAKTAAQSSTSANKNGAASSSYAAEADVVVKSEAQSATDENDESKLRTGEQDISDVSSFSDDHDAQLEKEDSRCFKNTTTCDESVDLSQTQPAVILSGSREIDNVSLGLDAIPRKVYFQMEGRNKLQDRPASAEEFKTGSSQSETVKVSFLNDVVYEDAGETVPYQNRVTHNTVAERSGRKVLAGTSKLAKDVHQLTKV